MLDKRMESMIQAASLLTAEDLDTVRSLALPGPTAALADPEADIPFKETPAVDSSISDVPGPTEARPEEPQLRSRRGRHGQSAAASGQPRGEYERLRTRESKVATTCLGHEREKHEWWPAGTEVIGRIGSEVFTARVVENSQVKSGRSLLITSGAANGRLCITPTRAAIEATEAYRQAHNLGRGGGITNGWEFWKPRM